MNAPAMPIAIRFPADPSLGDLLSALAPHGDRALVVTYADRTIRPGFHVTEVKAGSFVTLDCGGNPDTWRETVLQLEDLPADDTTPDYMAVAKFAAILAKVGEKVTLDPEARVTFELGRPGEAMRVMEPEGLAIEPGRVVLQLTPRAAICKPRHRGEQAARERAAATACCAPRSGCCG